MGLIPTNVKPRIGPKAWFLFEQLGEARFPKKQAKLTWVIFLSGHQLVDLDIYLIYQSWGEACDSFNLPDLPSSPGTDPK